MFIWVCLRLFGLVFEERVMAQEVERVGIKMVGSSRTIATRMLRHEDMNGSDRLFGGRLMEWIDDAAGIAARRHAGTAITTVAVDTL